MLAQSTPVVKEVYLAFFSPFVMVNVFTIDRLEIEHTCPRCSFYNWIRLREVRLGDVIICRGCKINIRLDDYMNECEKAEHSLRRAFERLSQAVGTINLRLRF